jgi:uncharacterized protein YchJ
MNRPLCSCGRAAEYSLCVLGFYVRHATAPPEVWPRPAALCVLYAGAG